MTTRGWSNSTGWASATRIALTVPAARRGDRVHHLHRLDDQQRVAGLDRVADLDERLGAGLGREEGGADHRRLDRGPGDRLESLRPAAAGGRGVQRAAAAGAAAASRAGNDRRGLAADLDPAIAVRDLDLGQLVVAEQARRARAPAWGRCASPLLLRPWLPPFLSFLTGSGPWPRPRRLPCRGAPPRPVRAT